MRDHSDISSVLFHTLVIAGIPLLFASWLNLENLSGAWPILALLILTPLALRLRRMENKDSQQDLSPLSGTVLLSCLLVGLLLVWNFAYQFYVARVDFSGDIFRGAFRNLHAPLYGWSRESTIDDFLLPAGSAFLFLIYLVWNPKKSMEKDGVVAPFAFLVLFSFSLGMISGLPRLLKPVAHYYHFSQGLDLFSGIPDLLRNYGAQMSHLGVHNNHYPPGVLLLFKIEQISGLHGLIRLLVIFSSLGVLHCIRSTCRLLGYSPVGSKLALLLFAVSPGVLTYLTLDPGFLVLLPGTLTVYFFLKSLIRHSVLWALAMGCAFAVYALFSFSAGFLAILLGFLLVIAWRWKLTTVSTGLVHAGAGMAAFAGIYLALYFLTGFNWLACLRQSIQNNTQQMSHGFDVPVRFLFRSTGAILAYVTAVGFPISYLSLNALLKGRQQEGSASWAGVLTTAFFFTVFASGFSGFFFLETERIWLFLTPALVVSAGGEASRQYSKGPTSRVVALLLCSLFLALAWELCLQPFSWR